ncbi:hypothetical protein G9A89_009507 [Geosiphon pyriformis]|nr:hypothetical protein G9A89_009507 [Geosiphon pyriformis]
MNTTLIPKFWIIRPHALEDLTTAIRHVKNYKMAMEEANYIKLLKRKLTNLQRRLKTISPTNNSNNKHKDISHYNNETKTTTHHYSTVKTKVDIGNEIAKSYKETNKTESTIPQNPNSKTVIINFLYSNNINNLYQSNISAQRLVQQNQFTSQNQFHNNNNRINPNNHYLTMPEESNFQQTVLSESEVIAPRLNSSNNTVPLAQIAQNANFSDIFLFEFKANKLPFLLSNVAVNKQKAITAIYTEAKETQELKISYQEQYTRVPAICGTFNKRSEKAPVFEFEKKKKLSITETFMALESTFNWAEETEQEIFKKTKKWNVNNTPCLTCENMLLEEYNWIDVAMRGKVCDQTCQYALSISEKVKKGTLFNVIYNSVLNKLYYYLHDAKIIFDLAMALINKATQEDVQQIKEAEYIKYIIELAEFNYKNKINIQLCEEYIMPCDNKWCSECYALSIFLSSKNDQEEIEFEKPKTKEEIATTPIYLTKNQPAIQLKYFDNNRQEIKPKKAHEIDTRYDLKYFGKDTLVL